MICYLIFDVIYRNIDLPEVMRFVNCRVTVAFVQIIILFVSHIEARVQVSTQFGVCYIKSDICKLQIRLIYYFYYYRTKCDNIVLSLVL